MSDFTDSLQCMVYLTQFKRDKWGIRGLVLTIWILDLSMVTFASVWTYLAILRNFGNGLGMLSSAKWSISPGCVDIWINYLWFTSAAATDLLVAFIVVLSLGATRYSYSPDAQRGLRKLIIYTISNGILTSIVAMAGVVLTFVGPPSWIQPGLTVVLARLYSNSLLAS
ncbi:hypothetical protein DL93DRAFT_2163194 [Clavulina sp. PMI_390]|nr:hypothetical protein DL93DRAFT_2163194 [Clavulina sp. PMI_390]